MNRHFLSVASGVAACLASSACGMSKSSNPLSATVAGPIPGVEISAPKLVDPSAGSRISVDQQPVTLVVANASTSGVRPLTYTFEVAADPDFTTKLFSREGIAPGDGQTRLRMPDLLAPGHTYFWHARAQDGANTGPYSSMAGFNVYTPVVIQAPTLITPAANSTVTTTRPQFVLGNAARSGPAGNITYTVEVAENADLSTKIASFTAAEQTSQTKLDMPTDLKWSTVYYWHARGADPTTTGAWSATQAFQTSPPTTPPPPPPPGGTDFNWNNVQIIASPDVHSWPITSEMTSLQFGGGTIHVDHTKRCQWPAVDIGGATQEATIWVFFNINGQWYGTGGERLRPCQTDKGLGNPSEIGRGWFYSSAIWGPMAGYVPKVGELVGFMIAAGSTRVDNNAPVHERTGVVLINFPQDNVFSSFPPFFWKE